jgi:hypothetical protein
MRPRPYRASVLVALVVVLAGTATPASAQQSMTDVLTFLLTNRLVTDEIPCGDRPTRAR